MEHAPVTWAAISNIIGREVQTTKSCDSVVKGYTTSILAKILVILFGSTVYTEKIDKVV